MFAFEMRAFEGREIVREREREIEKERKGEIEREIYCNIRVTGGNG